MAFIPISPAFLFQQLAALSSDLLQDVRTYTICANTTFLVGSLEQGSVLPVGGGFPLYVINPKMQVVCEVPGTCAFTGTGPLLLNTLNVTLANIFLASVGLPSLPSDFRKDTSDLLVKDVIFQDASSPPGCACVLATVSLAGFGLNMTFQDCQWMRTNASYPVDQAVFIGRPSNDPRNGNDTTYSSLLLKNCTFSSGVYRYAVITSSDSFYSSVPSIVINMENVGVYYNNITSTRYNYTEPIEYAGIMSLRYTSGYITDSAFDHNDIYSSRGAAVLINSDIDFQNVTFNETQTRSLIGKACSGDVAHVSNTTSSTGDVCVVDWWCGTNPEGEPPTCTSTSPTTSPTSGTPTTGSGIAPAWIFLLLWVQGSFFMLTHW